MNPQDFVKLSEQVSVQIVSAAFGSAMLQSVSIGAGNKIQGIRNILFGDNLTVMGDYQIVIGDGKVTMEPWASEEARDIQLKSVQDYLKFFKVLHEQGTSPKDFYPKAEIVLNLICVMIRSIGVKPSDQPPVEQPSGEETKGPKIEEINDIEEDVKTMKRQ